MDTGSHKAESWCTRCTRWLPLEAFTADLRTGRPRSNCRACALAVTKAWRAAHRDELLARKRELYAAGRAAGMTSYEAAAARDRRWSQETPR